MASIKRLNKRLQKEFGGGVEAVQQHGYLLLRGTLPAWEDVVRAGFLAAKHNPLPTLVNDITCTDPAVTREPIRIPTLKDEALEGTRCDVLVVGAGITGCAIARELARYDLSVLLVDKEHDVALHASSRNDGMVHPGLDLSMKTLKYHYNMRGNAMYGDVCAELGVPFSREGQYLCFSAKMQPFLYLTLPYWKCKGIPARVVGREELFTAEPGLHSDIGCALFFSTTGNVCPYGLTIAFAENAVQNGVRLSLDTAVLGMETKGGAIQRVYTNRGTVHPRIVVNAAGVFADDIAEIAGDRFFSIHPRRGTNSILDPKFSDGIARTNASVMRSAAATKAHTKGGGTVRTVHGNLLLGPDAVETPHKEDFATHPESIDLVMGQQRRTSARLNKGQIITWFTGVRAATYEEDFVIGPGRQTSNLIHAAGIQSPGLTAAPAIAQDVAKMTAEMLAGLRGGPVARNENFEPKRKAIPATAALPDAKRDALIRDDPDFGEMVCRCEQVSRGEVLAALRGGVPCDTVDGVKRRVRPGMGRCQGGFCGPLVAQIIAEEKGIPLAEVLKSGDGSQLLSGPTKAFEGGGDDA